MTEFTNQAATAPASPRAIHYYVDEAGDPTLFNRKGKIMVGAEGCSSHFILGKLAVDDPQGLTLAMNKLRGELLNDPYFKGIASMKPAQRKTALMFHAKDDLPEVRREVFRLLLAQKVRFYAVARDKKELLAYVREQNERDANYHYRGNELYDSLVTHLFRSRLHKADAVHICFSQRGAKDRTAAMRLAIEQAVGESERELGVRNQARIDIGFASPAASGGLQAVDYFLWALQRFYANEHEPNQDKRETEARYVEMIWPLVAEVNDMDHLSDRRRGVYYTQESPMTLMARDESRRKK